MFGLRHIKWYTLLILAACVFALIWARNADAATGADCPIGQFCIIHSATNVGATSGQFMTFRVKLRNNLNFASSDVRLKYWMPRQVIVSSTKPSANKGGSGVVIWRVPRLEPGDTWTATVQVEVLAYATKTVANTAEVFVRGERWLKSRLAYEINDPVVRVVVEEG